MADNPYSTTRTTDSKQSTSRIPLILLAVVVGILALAALGSYMWFLLGPTRPPALKPQQATPSEAQQLSG